MAISSSAIQFYIDDYYRATGRRASKFVCPITLRETDDSALVDAHILNKSLSVASRRTVVQDRDVDNFYGSRVEPDMVHFLNSWNPVDRNMTRRLRPVRAIFPDGTDTAVVPVNRRAVQGCPEGGFLDIQLPHGLLCLRTALPRNDARLYGRFEVEFSLSFSRLAQVASMLKAGYLCLFEMVGYNVICDPLLDTVRRSLAAFFYENEEKDSLECHFRDFADSTKIMMTSGNSDKALGRLHRYESDSISSRECFMHYTSSGMLFAQTLLFRINAATVSVTLPGGIRGADGAGVWLTYRRYLQCPNELGQKVHRALYRDGSWKLETRPLNVILV